MAYLGRPGATAPLTSADIPDNSITGAKIVAGTIEASDVAADMATQAELDTVSTVASAALPKAGGTMTGDLVPSTPLSHRNMVINGAMQVWQRATATTTADSNWSGSTADRWKIIDATDGSMTTERHAMSLAEVNTTGHAYALQMDCTGTDGTIASGQTSYVRTAIEAQDCQHLQYGTANAKTLTVSFWVKSNKTGIYTIFLYKGDTTTYIIPEEYTISSADTWEKKTITITPTAGSTSLITGSGGVIANNSGNGIMLGFGLAWGSSYHGTNDTWATDKYSTSNQVNWMDSTSNNFYLTGVQLELGSSATPFEHRSYGDELIRCLRYFQKINSIIGAGYQNGTSSLIISAGCVCNNFGSIWQAMRTTPTISGTMGNGSFATTGNAFGSQAVSSISTGANGAYTVYPTSAFSNSGAADNTTMGIYFNGKDLDASAEL